MRRRVQATVESRTVTLVKGWRAGELAREAGIRTTWSPRSGGWLIATKRVPDLVAYCQYRNIHVHVEDTTEAA